MILGFRGDETPVFRDELFGSAGLKGGESAWAWGWSSRGMRAPIAFPSGVSWMATWVSLPSDLIAPCKTISIRGRRIFIVRLAPEAPIVTLALTPLSRSGKNIDPSDIGRLKKFSAVAEFNPTTRPSGVMIGPPLWP